VSGESRVFALEPTVVKTSWSLLIVETVFKPGLEGFVAIRSMWCGRELLESYAQLQEAKGFEFMISNAK
jgi:hypothetical protein